MQLEAKFDLKNKQANGKQHHCNLQLKHEGEVKRHARVAYPSMNNTHRLFTYIDWLPIRYVHHIGRRWGVVSHCEWHGELRPTVTVTLYTTPSDSSTFVPGMESTKK